MESKLKGIGVKLIPACNSRTASVKFLRVNDQKGRICCAISRWGTFRKITPTKNIPRIFGNFTRDTNLPTKTPVVKRTMSEKAVVPGSASLGETDSAISHTKNMQKTNVQILESFPCGGQSKAYRSLAGNPADVSGRL